MENGMRLSWASGLKTKDLYEKLPEEKSIDQCAILCELVKRNVRSVKAMNAISNQTGNETKFWNNFKVSDFALAALDLLGFREYDGDREEIQTLISSGLKFE